MPALRILLPLLTFFFLLSCSTTDRLAKPDKPGRCAGFTDELVAESIGLSVPELTHLKDSRSLTNDQICTMDKKKLDRAIYRSQHPKRPDKPLEWAKLRAMQQASDDGKVKPDGLFRASMERAAITARMAGPQDRSDSLAWTALGPDNIGGRVRSIVIHPTKPHTMWAGSVSGGVWKSLNGGASWSPVNDLMSNLAVATMAMDPVDENIIYAGTGEGFFNVDAVRGYGIFRSVDGGNTFDLLPSTTPSPDPKSDGHNWYYTNRIAVSSNGAVLAATNGALFRSVTKGDVWTKVFTGPVPDVLFNPFDPDRALAATHAQDQTAKVTNSAILQSSDGGASWTAVKTFQCNTGDCGRIELAYSAATQGVAYASLDHNSGEIYKSTDGGATWTFMSNPKHLGSQGWYDNTLWTSPTDLDLVVIGGIDLHRSTDGGSTWTKISVWDKWPRSAHADHHVIVHHPQYNGTSNKTAFFGNDGGVWKAGDVTTVAGTTGWEDMNKTFTTAQFYAGAGNSQSGAIFGGTQDNGNLLWKGTTNWSQVISGDGGFNAIDPQDTQNVFAEYTHLALFRSQDGGNTFHPICKGIKEANSDYCDGTNETLFVAPFVLDPNNPRTLLAGAASLWRSANIRAPHPVWRRIKPKNGENLISAVAVAPGNSRIIWVGDRSGGVYYTLNGTAAVPLWKSIENLTPKRYVTRIVIDRNDGNRVYVAFGGYDADNLYMTRDGGATWTNVAAGLPAAPIRTIAIDPGDSYHLFVGTEVGIFESIDGGNTWSATNQGPANVSVDELFWYGNHQLVAATHGRGMFMASVTSPPSYALSVNKEGAGGGTVTADPAGIDCGATCSAIYPQGPPIVLAAVPDGNSVFAGWSGGGCSGTGDCTVVMSGAITVTAAFVRKSCTYTISPADKDFGSHRGFVRVRVTAAGRSDCESPAVSVSDPWITATPSPFRRNAGHVNVVVSSNAFPSERQGSIVIADTTFSITQAGAACGLTALVPAGQAFSAAGGTKSLVVKATENCGWSAEVDASSPWIAVDSGSPGEGRGTVSYRVDSNTGPARTGKITIFLTNTPDRKKAFLIRQTR
jgi:photosystem II stability/assembly factor-like uncharacterized protein